MKVLQDAQDTYLVTTTSSQTASLSSENSGITSLEGLNEHNGSVFVTNLTNYKYEVEIGSDFKIKNQVASTSTGSSGGSNNSNNNDNNNGNNNSEVISNVTFSSSGIANNSITINVSATTNNNSNIIGYHVFCIKDSDNSVKKIRVDESNAITIYGLEQSTKYNIYVVAYDENNKEKVSEIQSITTANEPVNLVPVLTSNTSGGGAAFASYSGANAYKVFDGLIPPEAVGNDPGFWVADKTRNQIGYDFGEGNNHAVTEVVYYGNARDANCRFTTFTLQYSDNGVDYTDVQTFTTTAISSYTSVKDLEQVFPVTTSVSPHRYWRIDGTNSGYDWSGLLELQFYGF